MNRSRIASTALALALTVPCLQAATAPSRPADSRRANEETKEISPTDVRLAQLAAEVAQMKKDNAALRAELEKKEAELAARTAALESALQKVESAAQKLRADFTGHTHALPNIGTLGANSVVPGGSPQIGLLWVPTSGGPSLASTGKAVLP